MAPQAVGANASPISFPETHSAWTAVGKQELWEHPFSNNNGNNQILHIRFHCAVRSLHLWYLWRMPAMDAPRALLFWPLVKGNGALGTRLTWAMRSCTCADVIQPCHLKRCCHFHICKLDPSLCQNNGNRDSHKTEGKRVSCCENKPDLAKLRLVYNVQNVWELRPH